MKIVVACASRHGATAGIAERIADTLPANRHEARAVPVDQVEDLAGFDAAVIGASAYMFHWLKQALRFVEQHRQQPQEMPVWLFSSGPVGTDTVDKAGQDVLQATRPKEFDELIATVRARGDRVFFGAYDPDADPIGFGERITRAIPAARNAMPAGDFRDWAAIDAWAEEIAAELV